MNDAVSILLERLPPYQGDQRLISRRQDTFDIIREIMRMHDKSAKLYNNIAAEHWAGDEMSTARHLFNFMRSHVPYTQEKTMKQTVKYPQAILAERLQFGNDCKHYASYIVGVGAALNRMGYPVKCFYRFGCYKDRQGHVSKHPGHVFAVFVIDGKEVWIDPVPEIGGFNSRALCPVHSIDKMPAMRNHTGIGSLYEISGISNESRITGHHMRPGGHHMHHGGHHYGGAHWLDTMPHRYVDDGDDIGKVKKKHKGIHINLKAPHIKIKPGKLLKKVVGAAPRNAYLALLKMNFGHLAVNVHNRTKNDKAALTKIHDAWRKIGGNTNKLDIAIKGGVNTHNRLHPHKKVSGYDNDMYMGGFANNVSVAGTEMDGVGVVAAAGAAALLAAAAPVIKMFANIFKSLGIKHDDVEDAADNADVQAASDHNDATDTKGDGKGDINDDGSVDHGNGVTTKVTKDKDGNQVMTYDVKDPTVDDGGSTTTTTKKKVTTHEDVDTDGDGETDATEDVKTSSGGGGSSFAAMMSNVTGFISDHKWWFVGGGTALLAIIIIPKLFSSKPKTRRK